jgi:cell division protein FtsA
MEEIFTLVHRDLIKSGFDEFLTARLVLTGRTVLVEGSAELAEQVFNMPVRIGYPGRVGGLVDVVNSPSYSTGVGLVLYGSRNMNHTDYYSREQHSLSLFEKLRSRMSSWFKASE